MRTSDSEKVLGIVPKEFKPFLRMPASVLVDFRFKELSDYKVYSLISFLCWVNEESAEYDRSGWVKLSKKWISEKLSLNRETVIEAVKRLTESGLIECEGRQVRVANLKEIERAIAENLRREAMTFAVVA